MGIPILTYDKINKVQFLKSTKGYVRPDQIRNKDINNKLNVKSPLQSQLTFKC